MFIVSFCDHLYLSFKCLQLGDERDVFEEREEICWLNGFIRTSMIAISLEKSTRTNIRILAPDLSIFSLQAAHLNSSDWSYAYERLLLRCSIQTHIRLNRDFLETAQIFGLHVKIFHLNNLTIYSVVSKTHSTHFFSRKSKSALLSHSTNKFGSVDQRTIIKNR